MTGKINQMSVGVKNKIPSYSNGKSGSIQSFYYADVCYRTGKYSTSTKNRCSKKSLVLNTVLITGERLFSEYCTVSTVVSTSERVSNDSAALVFCISHTHTRARANLNNTNKKLKDQRCKVKEKRREQKGIVRKQTSNDKSPEVKSGRNVKNLISCREVCFIL